MREICTCSLGGGRRLARERASSDPTQLNGAQDESDQTKQEDQPTNAWEEFSREMRQKEGWQPLRSWTVQRPSEHRVVDRVVVKSEWSDHEEHFQRDKQIG